MPVSEQVIGSSDPAGAPAGACWRSCWCVLALLPATLAPQTLVHAGMDLTVPAMLKELASIREVAVIYPQGTLAQPKDHIALTRMSPRQKKLAERLQIGEILAG